MRAEVQVQQILNARSIQHDQDFLINMLRTFLLTECKGKPVLETRHKIFVLKDVTPTINRP